MVKLGNLKKKKKSDTKRIERMEERRYVKYVFISLGSWETVVPWAEDREGGSH